MNFQIGVVQMAAQKNEATVRTWLEEAWNKGNIDEQAHIFSPAYAWAEFASALRHGVGGTPEISSVRSGQPFPISIGRSRM